MKLGIREEWAGFGAVWCLVVMGSGVCGRIPFRRDG